MAEDQLQPEVEMAAGGEVEAPEVQTEIAGKSYSEGEVQDLLKALKSEREARKAGEKSLKDKSSQLEQLKGIDPEQYAKLQAESAKRAELEAELGAKVESIEKSYADQLAVAKQQQEAATSQVQHLQLQWAFEKQFAQAGGRPGEFTELAFSKLRDQIKLEDDGNVAVVDKSGAYVVDDKGKRVNPSEWLQQFKSHALLGYTFQAERGSGSGHLGNSGASLAQGADMHSLSTAELFAQAFGKKLP